MLERISPARLALTVVGLAIGLMLVAIWSTPILPLQDLPQHVARHWMEARSLVGEPGNPYYVIDYQPFPNLGADVLFPPLLLVFSPMVASKIFVTLTVLLIMGGTALFLRELLAGPDRAQANAGRAPLPPWLLALALSAPLVALPQLLYGFINFASGYGVALIVAALGLRLRRARSVIGFVGLAVALVGLFYWHLAPWMIAVTLLGAVVAREGIARAVAARSLKPLLADWPFAAAVVPSAIALWSYARLTATLEAVPGLETDWGGLARKLRQPLTLLHGYSPVLTLVTLGLFGLALVVGPRWRAIASSRGHLVVVPLLAFAALYVAIPFAAKGVSDADSRLLPVVAILLFAFVATLPIDRPRVMLALTGLAVIVRLGSITPAWWRLSARLDQGATALRALGKGDRVLVVDSTDKSKDWPEHNFLGWSLIDKEIELTGFFAFPLQQPVIVKLPQVHSIRQTEATLELPASYRQRFDAVVTLGPARPTALPSWLRSTAQGGAIEVYDVQP